MERANNWDKLLWDSSHNARQVFRSVQRSVQSSTEVQGRVQKCREVLGVQRSVWIHCGSKAKKALSAWDNLNTNTVYLLLSTTQILCLLICRNLRSGSPVKKGLKYSNNYTLQHYHITIHSCNWRNHLQPVFIEIWPCQSWQQLYIMVVMNCKISCSWIQAPCCEASIQHLCSLITHMKNINCI